MLAIERAPTSRKFEPFCFRLHLLCRLAPLKYHAIGFDGVIQSDTERFVHHIVLYGVETDCSICESSSSSSDSCEYATHTLYAWAPGANGLVTPEDVGFRLGEGGYQSFALQMHYDNPDGEEGFVDDSGMRVYYTEELRDMDAGVILLGDPFIQLDGEQLPVGKSRYDFSCPSSCSEQYFEARAAFCAFCPCARSLPFRCARWAIKW